MPIARWTMRACACICAATIFGAHTACAWPGFDWDTWRDITGATAPSITAPQAGHSELLPLLDSSAEADDAERKAQWEARETAIRRFLNALLGEPADIERDDGPARLGERTEEPGYTRTHLLIPGEKGDPIPAYLLEPGVQREGRSPAIIVLHQTQANGKDEPCGLSGEPGMAFAVELVRRGFVCIVPDAIGFGERTPAGAPPYDGAHDFYRRHPEWSYFGKMNWDVSRVVDYLETLPHVDPARIGVIGHSHGAYGAIMAAAFEPRIAAAVASCGFTPLRADPNPERWSHLTALLPRLGFYLEDIASAPFDWHEILALLAPRPVYNWATADDAIFPNTDGLQDIYAQVRAVYALTGDTDAFTGRLEPGGHAFPREARNEAYEWLEERLAVPVTNSGPDSPTPGP